jgi:hypothetical protein
MPESTHIPRIACEVTTTRDGYASLQYPNQLSESSARELIAWVQMVRRKLRRRARVKVDVVAEKVG